MENHSSEVHEAIRRRAEEIYHGSGCLEGRDGENWRQAEAEILREFASQNLRHVVVRVAGVVYTGEYEADSADGYTPGEFHRGEAVSVRFDGDKLFLRRPNGRELETRVVKRIG